MRSPQFAPWMHTVAPRTFLRCAIAIAAGLVTLVPVALAGTPSTRVVPRAGSQPAVTATQLPVPSPAASKPAPARAQSATWTQVGPFNPGMAGRFNSATSRILILPYVDLGSDGGGYWEGYALSSIRWTGYASQLNTGIEQMVTKLEFPDGGGYFERLTIVGTDNSLRYSDDNGDTWAPIAFTAFNSEVLAPGKCRLVVSDKWSNVEYLVARTFDTTYADSGYVIAWSFDSGKSFQEMSYWIHANAADLWASQDGDGRLVFGIDTGDGNVTVQTMSEDDFTWHDTPAQVPSSGGFTCRNLEVTAQSFQDDAQRIWVVYGDSLWATTDAGNTWSGVHTAFTPAGNRGLCASIGTPDLLLWTDLYDAPYYARLYRSTDGGVTATAFDNSWPYDPTKVHDHPTNIDVFQWNFATALNARVRRPDGTVQAHEAQRARAATAPANAASTFERFYVASEGGVYAYAPGDTAGNDLTYNSGIINQELNDVATMRDGNRFDGGVASRDRGLLGMYETSPISCDMYTSVTTSLGNYVGDIVTTYGPDVSDFTTWSSFPDGFMLLSGGGPFGGVFPYGYEHSVQHRWLVADPSDPYSCFSGRDALEHSHWDSGSNTITTTELTGPIGVAHGGIDGFAIAPSNHNRWYLSMNDGTLMYSANAGATWSTSTSTGPAAMDAAQLARVKIVVNPANPLEAWCIGSSVARSTDGGVKWIARNTGLPAGNTLAFGAAYDSLDGNRVYLAAATGAYRWNGTAWTSILDPGMPAVQFRAVESVPTQGLMRFTTWGAGLWDCATTSTTGVQGTQGLALELAPRENPVRGAGRLDFTLPQAGHVRLELLDVQGRRVASLVDRELPAGRNSASVDAAKLGAGVYFARLATSQGTRSSRLVVLR